MPGKSKRKNSKTDKKASDNKVEVRVVLIIVWLLAGLYFGMSGWTKLYYDTLQEKAAVAQAQVDCSDPNQGYLYEGIQFCTLEDVQVFQHLEQMENAKMTWGLILPDPFPMVLSAFAFGVVGSVVNFFRVIVRRKRVPNLSHVSTEPALGGMTAVMVLGLSFLMPSIFTNANILLTPAVQPFLSLFAGVFSEQILKWFQVKLDKISKKGE